MNLSEREQRRFDADGYVVLGELLGHEEIVALRGSFERLFKGEFSTGVRPDEVNWQMGDDEGLTRQICNAWKADQVVAGVVRRPAFGELIARAAGWPGARVMIDNVIYKPPGARSLSHHRDNAYLGWVQPAELMSLWIALDDTAADGGTMELARGSHRWQPAPLPARFHDPADYRQPLLAAAGREGVRPDLGFVEVRAGGGSLHHGWTWHGSGPNLGATPRRALVIHALRSDARFNRRRLDEGTGPIYGCYCRPDDDAMDERDFPITWQRG